MMKYLNKIAILLIFTLGFIACDKNENFEIYPPANSFQIETPSSGTVMVLNNENLLNNALFLSWTDTNSTEATSYTIEVAKTGTDFAAPAVLGTSQSKNFSISVLDLNAFLIDHLGIDAGNATSLDFRVLELERSTPIIAIVLTPTEIEYNEFSIYGTFTNDWDKDAALPMTNVGTNMYELIVAIPENGEFLFTSSQEGLAGDFGDDSANPGMLIMDGSKISVTEGNEYRIKVDLNTMTFSVELAVYPELYLVGNATASDWNPNNGNHPMFKDVDQGGLYFYTGYFNSGSIKLVEDTGWQPQWGKGENDGELAGNPATQDGDPGTIDVTTAGYYTLTVDIVDLTYTLEAYDASGITEYDTIGVIGRATPTAWDSDTDMTKSTFNPHIWYMTLDLMESDGGDCDCGFKFRADNAWDTAWGGIENPPTLNHGIASLTDGKNIGVPETGNYTIFFNTLDNRYFYILN